MKFFLFLIICLNDSIWPKVVSGVYFDMKNQNVISPLLQIVQATCKYKFAKTFQGHSIFIL